MIINALKRKHNFLWQPVQDDKISLRSDIKRKRRINTFKKHKKEILVMRNTLFCWLYTYTHFIFTVIMELLLLCLVIQEKSSFIFLPKVTEAGVMGFKRHRLTQESCSSQLEHGAQDLCLTRQQRIGLFTPRRVLFYYLVISLPEHWDSHFQRPVLAGVMSAILSPI